MDSKINVMEQHQGELVSNRVISITLINSSSDIPKKNVSAVLQYKNGPLTQKLPVTALVSARGDFVATVEVPDYEPLRVYFFWIEGWVGSKRCAAFTRNPTYEGHYWDSAVIVWSPMVHDGYKYEYADGGIAVRSAFVAEHRST